MRSRRSESILLRGYSQIRNELVSTALYIPLKFIRSFFIEIFRPNEIRSYKLNSFKRFSFSITVLIARYVQNKIILAFISLNLIRISKRLKIVFFLSIRGWIILRGFRLKGKGVLTLENLAKNEILNEKFVCCYWFKKYFLKTARL